MTEKIPTFVAIIQNARAKKKNLQSPGLEIKIAACAKNRYQTRLALTSVLGPFAAHSLKFILQ